MSSLRNAVARRPHRERAQPLERRRLGLLEKHKDYSKRAQDYNKKKTQLKNLRQKASERNEDEFYFGMMSRKGPGSQIKAGKSWTGKVEGDRGNASMDMDTVRLLKTQDLGYIRTMRQVTMKDVKKLEQRLVMTKGFDRLDEDPDDEDELMEGDDSDDEEMPATKKSGHSTPRKINFLDDEDERDRMLEERDKEGESEGEDSGADRQVSEKDMRVRRTEKRLKDAKRRLKALTDAEQELEVQKAKMAKTATSGGTTRRGKKIMVRSRKR